MAESKSNTANSDSLPSNDASKERNMEFDSFWDLHAEIAAKELEIERWERMSDRGSLIAADKKRQNIERLVSEIKDTERKIEQLKTECKRRNPDSSDYLIKLKKKTELCLEEFAVWRSSKQNRPSQKDIEKWLNKDMGVTNRNCSSFIMKVLADSEVELPENPYWKTVICAIEEVVNDFPLFVENHGGSVLKANCETWLKPKRLTGREIEILKHILAEIYPDSFT